MEVAQEREVVETRVAIVDPLLSNFLYERTVVQLKIAELAPKTAVKRKPISPPHATENS